MGIEAFAEAALCLLPGWHVEAIEDISFLAPFKFYRSEPRARPNRDPNSPARRPVGSRLPADRLPLPAQSGRAATDDTLHGACTTRETTHARRRLRDALVKPTGSIIEAADIYRLYFHGPAYQVVEKAWWDGKQVIGLFAQGLPPNHHPSELPTVMAPRLIELCFQTAGSLGTRRAGPHGPATARSAKSPCCETPDSGGRPIVCRGHSRRRSRRVSMPKFWTRKEIATCVSRATRQLRSDWR